MKVCIAFAFLATLGFACCYVLPNSNEWTSSEEREMRKFLSEYKRDAKDYIVQQLNSLSTESCEGNPPSFEAPLEETINRLQEIEVEEETLCSLIRGHLIHVSQPLTRTFDACLPNDEAGVASWAVEAVVSVTDYLCGIDGEHILGFGMVMSFLHVKEDDYGIYPSLQQEETSYESFLKEHEDINAISVQVSQALCNNSNAFNDAAFESETRMRNIDLNEGSLCYLIDTKLEYVLEPLTIAIDTCGERSSYGKVAITLTRSFGSLVKYVCQSKGEEILDILHPCFIETGLRLYANNETMSKIERLGDVIFGIEGIESICSIAKLIRSFYDEHMDCCLPSTKRYIVGFMDAAIDPCNHL